MNMKRLQLILICFCLLTSSGFSKKVFLDSFVSYFLLHPKSFISKNPSQYGLKYDDINIKLANKNSIHGWYIYASKPTEKNIIYLHGIKGNVSTYLEELKEIHKAGANILIFDYRGFGKSKGKPCIQNSIEDAVTMYDYLIHEKKVSPQSISLFGFSYGGAVAVELALQREVKAMLLESTFASLREISIKKYTKIVSPFVAQTLLNSEESLKRIKIPVIISYAEEDQIVPVENSIQLFNVANHPKYLYEIKDAEHQNIGNFVTPEYIELIKKILV